MLLSVDWDYYAGSREHVFDSPLWGSPDLEYHRSQRWLELARKRGGSSFEALYQDFPLYGNPLELLILEGLPCFVAVSHESGIEWLAHVGATGCLGPTTACLGQNATYWGCPPHGLGCQSLLHLVNLDSHHDLFSSSGDASRVRPGNWVGRALECGLISHYTCLYPSWHAGVAVSEGFNLERTWVEIGTRFSKVQVTLERPVPHFTLESAITLSDASSVLLVQSPAWTNPLYDPIFLELIHRLKATVLTPPMARAWK